jgi:hypothetical protein
MDTRLPATKSTAGNAAAHVPRRDLGEWGMDYQTAGSGIRKPICKAATGGR